jgi:hypothetical protein
MSSSTAKSAASAIKPPGQHCPRTTAAAVLAQSGCSSRALQPALVVQKGSHLQLLCCIMIASILLMHCKALLITRPIAYSMKIAVVLLQCARAKLRHLQQQTVAAGSLPMAQPAAMCPREAFAGATAPSVVLEHLTPPLAMLATGPSRETAHVSCLH